MKKHLFLLLSMSLLVACSESENHYKVTIHTNEYTSLNNKVYLKNYSTSEIIDSVDVKQKNIFLKGDTDKPQLVYVSDSTKRSMFIFVLEPGEIKVEALDKEGFTTSGTPLNSALNELFSVVIAHYNIIDIIGAFNAAHDIFNENNNNVVGIMALSLMTNILNGADDSERSSLVESLEASLLQVGDEIKNDKMISTTIPNILNNLKNPSIEK